jgi:hypothetical protein
MYDPTQMRMGNLFQDILPFCIEWVSNAKKFLDVVLEDLATNLKKKSSFSILVLVFVLISVCQQVYA